MCTLMGGNLRDLLKSFSQLEILWLSWRCTEISIAFRESMIFIGGGRELFIKMQFYVEHTIRRLRDILLN